MTDPFPGPGLYGWIDTTPALNGQGEIGDKCSWALASPALVTMSGNQWPVQPLFSNRALAAGVNPCVLGAATDCNLTALNPSLASPRAPNTPVVFTGVATCVSGATPSYQFWVRSPLGTWTMVQDFGASNAYNWPGGQTLGRWTFQVRVRGSTETIPYDNFINLDYDLATAPCRVPTLVPSTPSPAAAGTPVLLVAATSGCGAPPPLYQFWVRTPDSAWHMVQDYTTANTYNWNSLNTVTGVYTLEVAVKNTGSIGGNDALLDISYSLINWPASYDVSSVPTNWVMGQSQTFPVKVTNTGSQTWPSTGTNPVELDLHFASYPGGAATLQYWLSSQAFSLPSDVAPGATVTVSVTLSPPGYGHLVLETELIKEHEFWFSQFAPVNVNVAPPTWSASYDVSSAPTSWVMGHAQTFNVVVANTGNQAWPSTGTDPVELDLHFASYPGGSTAQRYWLSSLAFSLPADVAPGASATVSVTLSPPGYGHLVLEAEMIREHQFWFSQFAPVNVSVAAPVWSASYNLGSVPTSWVMGQSQTFSVIVTNTGNQAWPSTGPDPVELDLHFASYAGGSGAQRYWLSSQAFSLPSDVAPGQAVTVTMTWIPPGYGHLVLEAEMIKEHQFWFSQFAPTNVSISPI